MFLAELPIAGMTKDSYKDNAPLLVEYKKSGAQTNDLAHVVYRSVAIFEIIFSVFALGFSLTENCYPDSPHFQGMMRTATGIFLISSPIALFTALIPYFSRQGDEPDEFDPVMLTTQELQLLRSACFYT